MCLFPGLISYIWIRVLHKHNMFNQVFDALQTLVCSVLPLSVCSLSTPSLRSGEKQRWASKSFPFPQRLVPWEMGHPAWSVLPRDQDRRRWKLRKEQGIRKDLIEQVVDQQGLQCDRRLSGVKWELVSPRRGTRILRPWRCGGLQELTIYHEE